MNNQGIVNIHGIPPEAEKECREFFEEFKKKHEGMGISTIEKIEMNREVHKLFGSMRYHPYDPPECPKRMWSKHSSEFNCPIFGDTPEEEEAYLKMLAFKRVAIPLDDKAHQAILRWIKKDICNEEFRKLKEREKDEQDIIQSKKG